MRYLMYGLAVAADRPLPGLASAVPQGEPALRVRVGGHDPSSAAGLRPLPGAAGEDAGALTLLRSASGAWYRLRYRDGTEFSVAADGGAVGCSWLAPLTLEDTATYLYGPVLGFVLRLRGVTCLHASAVGIGGDAVLLCGPAGSGKSTTAAALAQRGHSVLSDDVSALEGDGALRVRPGYPQLRLWPDAVQALYGGGAQLPRLTPNWDKRYLELAADGGSFHPTALPVRAVYVLAGREAARAPRAEALTPREALLSLVANTYMSALPDLAAQARDLARYAALLRGAPVLRLVPHADPERLGELCALIERSVAAGAAHA